jgi:hypothetical protein
LPDSDPSLDALSDRDRSALVSAWWNRSASERRVADAFAVVRDDFAALGAAPEVLALAARAVDDEYRHADLCRLVGSRVAGRELDEPSRLTLVVPEYKGTSERLARTLRIVGHCVLNETTASAFLETAIADATGSLARAALRELLSDEVDHARLGWAHLQSVGPDIRREISPWLVPMARANLAAWREPRPYEASPALTAHGAPSPEAVERVLVAAMRDLVVPGLEHLGIQVSGFARLMESSSR